MKYRQKFSAVFQIIALTSIFSWGCLPAVAESGKLLPQVVMQTSLGEIVLELDQRRYKTASFYRTVRADNQPNELLMNKCLSIQSK